MKIILALFFFTVLFCNLGTILDITQKPIKSDIIFCLGGNKDRTIRSLKLLEESYSKYKKLYFVGNEKLLKSHIKGTSRDINLTTENIIYVAKMKNTMDEIIYIDNIVEKNKYESILIVTDPPHSRRVDFMIQKFSKYINYKYIIVSSEATWWNRKYYFLNTEALLFSIKEVIKIPYNYFKYNLFIRK